MKKGTIIPDITKYELQMTYDSRLKRRVPVKDTYVEKSTGEIVKINWTDGKFRVI